MIWKAIGKSVIGTSHLQIKKLCEDAVAYETVKLSNEEDVLLCCVSDGAGSARYASWASEYVTKATIEKLSTTVKLRHPVNESTIYALVEDLYENIDKEADLKQVPINEFSCTYLGCILYSHKAIFFQIGDGAIIRNAGVNSYSYLWWPDNGEYQNSTCFIVDDISFANLSVSVIEERINEVALFTDGLQLLALSLESMSVHQPFFNGFFKVLRMVKDENSLAILSNRLNDYLNSSSINERTDDDKTLFLATRLNHEV